MGDDADRIADAPVVIRCGAVLVAGLGVGALTSVLQQYLDSPWSSLVNAASPWLTAMFVLAFAWRSVAPAAVAGLVVGLLEILGYYSTAHLRGYPAGRAILVFWAACALIGGPIFGFAGWLWRRGPDRYRQLGAAAMSSAYLAEGIVAYGIRLHYLSSAALFTAIGVALVVWLGWWRDQVRRTLVWMCLTLPAAAAAEIALGEVYRQTR